MQLIKFALVGVLGTTTQYLTLLVGVMVFGYSSVTSSSVGFVFGAFVNHHFNRKFTFTSTDSYGKTLFGFMLSASFLFVVNFFCMYILTEIFSVHFLAAQVVSTAIVFFSGYTINKYIVFNGD